LRCVLVCVGVVLSAIALLRADSTPASLNVCHAGSLSAAFADIEEAFKAQHPEVSVVDVSGGSVTLARRLASGDLKCDVFAPADYLDIDRMLKPARLADYTVIFARGRMVLAYLATDPKANGVASAGDFRPPASIPDASPDWYRKLLAPGVRIGGAHPFLDPGGYRAHMILDLAQRHYGVPNLYNALLEHYEVMPAAEGPGTGPVLGREFDFQFSYEHSAAAAAKRDPAYRYVHLPDRMDLSASNNETYYAQASVTMPGLGTPGAASSVTMPASRAAWGLTIVRRNTSQDNALAFAALVLSPIGTAALNAHGPVPLTPAVTSTDDYKRLPSVLRVLVSSEKTVP
jgi:molybdate/tungstate transport system substrate-binding protein